MPKILIVEDDPSMAVALKDGFEYEGYEVVVVADGATGLERALAEQPDLLILDVMLPKLSGHDVCREIRRSGSDLPILMLTARGQEIDKVLGLKLGADDYVTKPFGFLELAARAEALLRRAGGHASAAAEARFGNVTARFRSGEVEKSGRRVEMSARELRLLEYFVRRKGEIVTREELLDAVWGYETAPLTRTVDMHVAKLRKKIEDDPASPRYLVTVHRMGYKFNG
jgi:two-component system alkaline phosphatase synthesis response regulator PhoP